MHTSKQYLNCIIIEFCPFLHCVCELIKTLDSTAATDLNVFISPKGFCVRGFAEAGENEMQVCSQSECLRVSGQNYSTWNTVDMGPLR